MIIPKLVILIDGILMEWVVITAKIPKELRDKARKYGIVINKIVRKALEEEIRKREEEEFRKSLEDASKILRKLNLERVKSSIREDRER